MFRQRSRRGPLLLNDYKLFNAETSGLERLAKWLGEDISPDNCTEKQYRSKLVFAILKAEKRLVKSGWKVK